MRLLVAVVVTLTLFSCAFTVREKHPVKYYRIEPKLKRIKTNADIWLCGVEAVPPLDTEKILYKKDGYYGYYAYARWLCSPSCMLRDVILETFGFREAPRARFCLKIELFNFEPHFNGENFVYFKARCLLYSRDFEIKREKVFEYRIGFSGDTLSVISSLSTAVELFVKDLSNWIDN